MLVCVVVCLGAGLVVSLCARALVCWYVCVFFVYVIECV